MKRSPGLTLVETMVAMVMLMMVIGAIYATYHNAQQAMIYTEEREDVYQTARIVLAQINTELSCAYQPASADASTLIGDDGGDGTTPEDSDVLSFVTTAHASGITDAPAGDLCQVTYRIEQGSDGEPAGLYIEEHNFPGLSVEGTTSRKSLFSELIIGLNCKYMTPESEDWQIAWIDEGQLPYAVRVELVLKPPREGAQPIMVASTANLVMAGNRAKGSNDDR